MPKSFYVPSELVVIISLYKLPREIASDLCCESNPQGAGVYMKNAVFIVLNFLPSFGSNLYLLNISYMCIRTLTVLPIQLLIVLWLFVFRNLRE